VTVAEVRVEAWRYGDGWLQVDTAEWIAERGEYDEELTEELREWLDDNGYRYPYTDGVLLWAKHRTGTDTSGLYGDGECWEINTCNVENFLSDELGCVVFGAGELGELMVTQSGDGGLYREPEVYRSTALDTACWADYGRAYGGCVNGHEWLTDDAHRLYVNGGRYDGTPTVSGQARVPFGDRSRAYIACPDCGKALRFTA
jgi:hypothetical protein